MTELRLSSAAKTGRVNDGASCEDHARCGHSSAAQAPAGCLAAPRRGGAFSPFLRWESCVSRTSPLARCYVPGAGDPCDSGNSHRRILSRLAIIVPSRQCATSSDTDVQMFEENGGGGGGVGEEVVVVGW